MPKFDLSLPHPLMNAAGTLGFAPDPYGPFDLSLLGAFVTHPVSAGRRSPAHGVRFRSYPGGFLLHSGYPNPGINSVIRQNRRRWARAPLGVIVHLLGTTPEEVSWMVARLEGLEGVIGVEVGLPPQVGVEEALAFAQAGIGELPLILRLPMENAVNVAGDLGEIEIAALSLAPPRGTLPLPRGERITGRLYGPGIYPGALRTVDEVAQQGLPVIGAGGVYHREQAQAMLAAGALAVQLDSVLWRGGWDAWNPQAG